MADELQRRWVSPMAGRVPRLHIRGAMRIAEGAYDPELAVRGNSPLWEDVI